MKAQLRTFYFVKKHSYQFVCGMLCLLPQLSLADAPVNALWNDDSGFLIELMDKTASCSGQGYKQSPWLAVGLGGQHPEQGQITAPVSKIKVCLSSPPVALCTSGSINYHYKSETHEYEGNYDFALDNGHKWAGYFRAQYCSVPANKSVETTEDTDCRGGVRDQDEANVRRCTARLNVSGLSVQDRASALNVRGNTYDTLKQYDLAIADYTEVIRLQPDFEYAYANRALEYCRIEKYPQALLDYDKALSINPRNTYALYGRGIAHLKAGDVAKGNADTAAAVKLDPQVESLYRSLGLR